jgi:DNA replication protein DnaC
MHELGLRGMARAFQEMQTNPEAEALTHADWLALLLDREAADRRDRRLKIRLRSAKLRFSQACPFHFMTRSLFTKARSPFSR